MSRKPPSVWILMTAMSALGWSSASLGASHETWSFCPASVNYGSPPQEWNKHRFQIKERWFKKDHFKVDVKGSLTHELQRTKMRIVRGSNDALMPVTGADLKTWCDKKLPNVTFTTGSYNYYVGLVELEEQDHDSNPDKHSGANTWPHVLVFVPLVDKDNPAKKYFYWFILSLPPFEHKPQAVSASPASNGETNEHAAAASPVSSGAERASSMSRADALGGLTPALLKMLLEMLYHNGVVHGSN